MDEASSRFIVAVAAVILRDGEANEGSPRVLAMRRSEGRPGAGAWETLSGRLFEGEDPLAGLQREIDEECGLEVALDERPVDAYTALRGDEPMIVLVYRARYLAGEVRRSSEHDAHRWCTPDEFAAITPFTQLALAVRRAAQLIAA